MRFKAHSQKMRLPEDEEGSMIFEFFYNIEKQVWQKWETLVRQYEHPDEEEFLFRKMFVHNV